MNFKNISLVKSSEFREEHLKLSGVWAWQSDLQEAEEYLVPVPLTKDAMSNEDSLLIHARIRARSGTLLSGLVVHQPGIDEIFALEVLVANNRFTFNKYAPELSLAELRRLAVFLNEKEDTLLPFQYSVVPQELQFKDDMFSF